MTRLMKSNMSLTMLILTLFVFPLVQPTGTMGVKCCCSCHTTLNSTRSWNDMSPKKTCWLSETPSSLSRRRYSVGSCENNVGTFAEGQRLVISPWHYGWIQGLGEMPQDTQSARGRRSLPGSGTVRASSLTRATVNQNNRWVELTEETCKHWIQPLR